MEANAMRRFANVATHRLLICPYSARKPFHYLQVPECAARGFTLPELKAHVYKYHEFLCPHGCKAFPSQRALDDHVATGQICVPRIPEIEGFGGDVHERIRNRTHPEGHQNMTREEEDMCLWKKIYELIFPESGGLIYPPAMFYDERHLNHHAKLKQAFAQAGERFAQQGWQGIIDLAMETMFPNTAMATAAAAPRSSMAAGYPGGPGGGDDAADWGEDPADPPIRDGEDRERAMTRDTLGIGGLFDEPTAGVPAAEDDHQFCYEYFCWWMKGAECTGSLGMTEQD